MLRGASFTPIQFRRLAKHSPVISDLKEAKALRDELAYNQLVHAEDWTAVASVMIGGRLVVDKRRLYEALEPVVGSYRPGLASTPYHIHPAGRAWIDRGFQVRISGRRTVRAPA